MPIAEPMKASFPNPALRYVLATRPAFLSVTLFACLAGFATANLDGNALDAASALATLLFALLAHAGVNVLNDYYDDLNGTDRTNTERVHPFTGGSRFIQNGLMTPGETLVYGFTLMASVVPAGLWLASRSGPGLIVIGLAGLAVGWAYSAPPAKLNSRGLGEPCVALGFAFIVIGTDYVQRGAFALLPVIAAVPYALLVTNILYVNQFPDRRADEAAGKRHWVVRLGPERARWGYPAIALSAYAWLLTAVVAHALPPAALLGLAAAPLSTAAARELLRHAGAPYRLAPAIRLTIGAAWVHGALLPLGLFLA